MSSFSGLWNNAALLLILCVIYDTFAVSEIADKRLRDVASGLLVGLVGIAVMLTPWSLEPGVFFDTRWVLLSLCGLFFGALPTVIAVVITGVFRLYQGGGGAIVGTVVIVVTAAVGLAWRYGRQRWDWRLNWVSLYAFGMVVQLAMLACMFLMPLEVRYRILGAVAPPILSIFPLLTMALGIVLRRQEERRNSEGELRRHKQLLDRERGLLRGIVDSIPDLIFFKDTRGEYLGCNKAFEAFVGRSEGELKGKTDLDLFDAEAADRLRKRDGEALAAGRPVSSERWADYPDGRRVLLDTTKTPFRGLDGTLHGVVGISRDITERQRADAEREKLQAQLAHAQKMESVGRLAGGVAHDFNNMLGVILGHTELALMGGGGGGRLHHHLKQIEQAATHSAELTRQLLAYARKQTIAPQSLVLNDKVGGMLKMLGRLIGEDIELEWAPAAKLWPVKMDPSQIDQILANLCVNSRDAIPGVGRITIETANAVVDESWCAAHADAAPGEYVRLTVRDTGCGMDEQTRELLFEPFFTTKGVGLGTGLGLATVYGIVRQNRGFITVASEPGQGAEFHIFLPRGGGEVEEPKDARATELVRQGHGTVLLVEDEPAILALAAQMLETLGYRVVAASGPREALHLAENHDGEIHLLLTDVVMPEMDGRVLADQVRSRHPDARWLFMSGYAANVIETHGIVEDGVHFIQKPFSMRALATKVQEAMNLEPATEPSPEPA